MKNQRRVFSTEFKHEAAASVLDQGYTVTEACRSLDIGKTALRRWIDQLRAERGGVTPTSKAMTPDQQRIQVLEKRVRELDIEKRILKKATVDSIDQRNTYIKIWVNGGSLNEESIYSTIKRDNF